MTVPKMSQLRPGVGVNIVLKADQRSGRLTSGSISEVDFTYSGPFTSRQTYYRSKRLLGPLGTALLLGRFYSASINQC